MKINPKTRTYWNNEQIKILKRLYPNTDNKEIARKMNYSYSVVVHKAFALGLKKSKKYRSSLITEQMRKAGEKFMFKQGQISWNKGKSWDVCITLRFTQCSRKGAGAGANEVCGATAGISGTLCALFGTLS